jgi:hypothetical protein
MFKELTAKLTVVACTVLLSATCVLSAVGPASTSGKSAVASATRLMA